MVKKPSARGLCGQELSDSVGGGEHEELGERDGGQKVTVSGLICYLVHYTTE